MVEARLLRSPAEKEWRKGLCLQPSPSIERSLAIGTLGDLFSHSNQQEPLHFPREVFKPLSGKPSPFNYRLQCDLAAEK